MFLFTVVINNEELIDELITGWLDMGITDATVVETTDFVQLISHHVPIFAGFRALAGGGVRHNKTIFAVVEDKSTLDLAVTFLKELFSDTGKPNQGYYFVNTLFETGKLGIEKSENQRESVSKKKSKGRKK